MPDAADKPASEHGAISASSLPIERKLATILSADVAEFSRLMSEDEEQTLRAFRGHKKVFEALVATHHGRVFNTAGDAILAEFASAVEAVRCATDVQSALRTRNDKFPPNRQVRFRIGVNLGDVMIQGQDLLGDGVNLAARLQTAAEPGGVCISGSVHDQIRNKLSLTFQSLGERNYKNIPQPVRTFAIAESEGGAVLPSPKAQSGLKKGAAIGIVAGILAAAGVGYGAYVLYRHGRLESAPATTAMNQPAPQPAAAPNNTQPQSSAPTASPAPHKAEVKPAPAPPAPKKSAPASAPEFITETTPPPKAAEPEVTPTPAAETAPPPRAASQPAAKFEPSPQPATSELRPRGGARAGGASAARAGEYDGVYSGDVCYGKVGALPNHCYKASGTVTGNRISGTWPVKGQPQTMFMEGRITPDGDVTIEMHSDQPDGTRVAAINLSGTIRNGTILATGKFLRGRPASLDWHLKR